MNYAGKRGIVYYFPTGDTPAMFQQKSKYKSVRQSWPCPHYVYEALY